MASTILGYETERTSSRGECLGLPEFATELKPPSAAMYWRTVRHLRWPQIVWLGRQRLRQQGRFDPPTVPDPVRLRDFPKPTVFPEWQPAAARRMIESGEFDLLNLTISDGSGVPWSATGFPRLWVYHLNYCDMVNLDLSRSGDQPLLQKAMLLMLDWCEQNTTGREVGWEPYPLSLRIVNWLKFLIRNGSRLEAMGEKPAVDQILSSLRCQTLVLEKTLEFHLRANHLLKNIKALLFAGTLLETPESNRWRAQATNLLGNQLKEQILADGGHFERSTMYHAEVFEDLLDLETLVLARGLPLACTPMLSRSIARMADFMVATLHPDGEIALFNDSAFGISPAANELLSRAGRNTSTSAQPEPSVNILPETGYAVVRGANSKGYLIFDCGPVGPDYQPGHAHCDVLSYELSLHGRRVVVDTGTSTYEPGSERHFERSTAAHNTIRIDGEEQAEIWASFRVGRRPKVSPIESAQISGFRFVRGSHNGYRRLGVVHSRQIILSPENCWVVVDSLRGAGVHRIESFVHFHPDVQVEVCPDIGNYTPDALRKRLHIDAGGRRYFLMSSNVGSTDLVDAWYSPQFGRREKQSVFHWKCEGRVPVRLVYAFVPAGGILPSVSLSSGSNLIKIDDVHIPLG